MSLTGVLHFCVFPKAVNGFRTSYVVICFAFSELKWEVIVRFAGIVDHHCSYVFFTIISRIRRINIWNDDGIMGRLGCDTTTKKKTKQKQKIKNNPNTNVIQSKTKRIKACLVLVGGATIICESLLCGKTGFHKDPPIGDAYHRNAEVMTSVCKHYSWCGKICQYLPQIVWVFLSNQLRSQTDVTDQIVVCARSSPK